ncbi:hypothetical protein NC652_010019 [Populus alba x Populus x berolinensis]|nr:hypothetical protein NC652_010019 [Populus alba x Populus x berolinensis]
MGIFCLPPSGVIPLHNHPGMTVFSKLLFGTMHIKSYDWVADVPATKQTEVRLAKVKVNSKLTAPCNTSILYPTDGGKHALLYSSDSLCSPRCARPLHTLFLMVGIANTTSDFPFANFSVNGVSIPEEEKEGYAWLQEREKPEDLTFVGELYGGPAIVEK